jgi:hypothetical protein
MGLFSTAACIYADINTPLAYRSPTLSDVGPNAKIGERVFGEACNHMVLGLVAWGDGGYHAAMEQARSSVLAETLVDVTADSHGFNVLGVYQRGCTKVSGRVVR